MVRGAPGELAELQGIIARTIQVRQLTLGSFFILALLLRFALRIRFPLPLIFIPLLWFLLTFPFRRLIAAQREERGLHWVHAGFFILELMLVTYLIHYLQGVEWIGLIFYLYTVIYANFFLPALQGYLITGLAIAFYALLVALEMVGVLPHWQLFPEISYRSPVYVVTTLLAGGLGVYAILAYTIQIFAAIYRRKNQELEKLSAWLLTAQEEERRRLAQRLHDELGQTLTVAKLNLGLAARAETAVERERHLREAERSLEMAIEEARALSHGLRPPLLDELGLIPALEQLIAQFRATSELEIEFTIDEVDRLPASLEMFVYQAVQEGLTNAVRHAEARHLTVRLTRKADRLRLEIADDGKGCDPERALRSGLGLRGMRERALLAGGHLQVLSRPGRGTRLVLELPIPGDGEQD